MKILRKKFFERNALKVAPNLLGCFLVRKIGNKIIKEKIVEVEAYDGSNDKASHAHKGQTKRNEVMFGEAGRFYVYLVYGMYEILNIVTDKNGYPSAVLIRGTENISGPGKLTKNLKIDQKLNAKTAIPKNGLWFEQSESPRSLDKKIKKAARIGVSYAGPIWSKKKYRFLLV